MIDHSRKRGSLMVAAVQIAMLGSRMVSKCSQHCVCPGPCRALPAQIVGDHGDLRQSRKALRTGFARNPVGAGMGKDK